MSNRGYDWRTRREHEEKARRELYYDDFGTGDSEGDGCAGCAYILLVCAVLLILDYILKRIWVVLIVGAIAVVGYWGYKEYMKRKGQ